MDNTIHQIKDLIENFSRALKFLNESIIQANYKKKYQNSTN